MQKDVIRTITVCDICQKEANSKCEWCGKDLCNDCHISIKVRSDNTHLRFCDVVCKECADNVYGEYLKAENDIEDLTRQLSDKIGLSNKLINKIKAEQKITK